MKRIIATALALLMILSLCACQQGDAQEETSAEGLQIGYGRADITAPVGTTLGGYGNDSERLATQILDPIYATCLAMRDGEDTVLLIGTDVLKSVEDWTQAVRTKLSAETGVPEERILISATHTHSAPSLSVTGSSFFNIYVEGLVQAGKDAVADLAPATISSTRLQTENMSFVRHYRKSDGTYCGDGFGSKVDGKLEDYATEGDKEMILVKYDRPEDKKDILLMNFQAHPCLTGSEKETDMSADFIGFTRKIIEEETDMKFIYFTGGAGNQNTTSYFPEAADILDVNNYSEKLAQYAIDALPNLQRVEGDGIKTVQNNYVFASNTAELDKMNGAMECQLLHKNGDPSLNEKMAQYGLTSMTHVQGILMRGGRPDTYTMELNAIYVGGMAFITAPYEMFSTSAMHIKENSPVETTIICTLANQYWNYFATEDAYDYYAYEANTSYFAKGCAEATAEQFVQMLNSLVEE